MFFACLLRLANMPGMLPLAWISLAAVWPIEESYERADRPR